jgi:hypothetical protein
VYEKGGLPFCVSKRKYPVGAGLERRRHRCLKVVKKRDEREADEELLLLDEIAREGARRMLIEAFRVAAADYVEPRGDRDEHGHALAVHALVVRSAPGALTLGLTRHRSMTAGVMSWVSASASPATSCHPRLLSRRTDAAGRFCAWAIVKAGVCSFTPIDCGLAQRGAPAGE